MKLKPGLGASYAIRPGNGVGLFYSSRTHTWQLPDIAMKLQRSAKKSKIVQKFQQNCVLRQWDPNIPPILFRTYPWKRFPPLCNQNYTSCYPVKLHAFYAFLNSYGAKTGTAIDHALRGLRVECSDSRIMRLRNPARAEPSNRRHKTQGAKQHASDAMSPTTGCCIKMIKMMVSQREFST